MKFTSLIFGLLFLFPSVAIGASLNAGFVEGLWYSKEPVFVGTPVRIYAALRDNSESDITGTVLFKDGSTTIGTQDVSAVAGRLVEAWADWSPTYGDHTITATLENVEVHAIGQHATTATVMHAESKNTLFVDYDTDGDGIGNRTDTDDDGDGISDKKEKTNGTDPLDPKSPAPQQQATDTPQKNAATSTPEYAKTENIHETTSPAGLEEYFGNGTVKNLFSNITDKVNESKQALDAYRGKRNVESTPEATSTKSVSTTTTSTQNDTATITRTQIGAKHQGLLALFVSGIKKTLNFLYTMLLWFVSWLLAFPAFVELLLMLCILFGIYKLARMYGARRR
jgi:hypothetical protein